MNCRAVFSFPLLAVLLLVTPIEAQSQKGKKPRKAGQPVALLVVFGDYEPEKRKLHHTIDSGVAMALRLMENGYAVLIVTDGGNEERIGALLSPEDENVKASLSKGGIKKPSIVVQTASSSLDLERLIDQWLKSSFLDDKQSAPFGLIGFNGHGVERAEGALSFLAPEDDETSGGLNIRSLQTKLGKRPLPVFLIVDTCREKETRRTNSGKTHVQGAPNVVRTSRSWTDGLIDELQGNRLSGFDDKGVRTDEHANYGVLTVYSTLSGRVAKDSHKDLFATLAHGLEQVKSPRAFQASLTSEIPLLDRPPHEPLTDLSLLTWFNHGLRELLNNSVNGQSGHVEFGYIDQSMVIASLGIKLYPPPPLNLLDGWGHFAGNLDVEGGLEGPTIRRNKAELDQLFSTGVFDRLADFDEPLDPAGKAVLIELIATGQGLTTAGVRCLLQPGNHEVEVLPGGGVSGSQLSADWNKYRELPFNRRMQFVIPLDMVNNNDRLKSMSISVDPQAPHLWPVGAAVTVTRLSLIDRPNKNLILPPVNLMARWWFSDVLSDEDESGGDEHRLYSAIRFNPQDKTRVFELKRKIDAASKLTGKGGSIFPPIDIDASEFNLALVVRSFKPINENATHCTVGVSIRKKSKPIASAELKIDQKACGIEQRIPISESGFADYIGITTDAAELEIEVLEFLPKNFKVPPKKVKVKN